VRQGVYEPVWLQRLTKKDQNVEREKPKDAAQWLKLFCLWVLTFVGGGKKFFLGVWERGGVLFVFGPGGFWGFLGGKRGGGVFFVVGGQGGGKKRKTGIEGAF